MQAWYVVCSRPQQEVRAATELSNQDFEVFLPILKSKPMFPRYLFAYFDRDKDDWGRIRSTRGCRDILKNGNLPSPVPEPVIEALRAYRPPTEETQAPTEFTKGQLVRITEGPGAGLAGIFDKDIKKRTAALLKIMGKTVEIPRQSIRAA